MGWLKRPLFFGVRKILSIKKKLGYFCVLLVFFGAVVWCERRGLCSAWAGYEPNTIELNPVWGRKLNMCAIFRGFTRSTIHVIHVLFSPHWPGPPTSQINQPTKPSQPTTRPLDPSHSHSLWKQTKKTQKYYFKTGPFYWFYSVLILKLDFIPPYFLCFLFFIYHYCVLP